MPGLSIKVTPRVSLLLGSLKDRVRLAVTKVEEASEEPGFFQEKLSLLEAKTTLKKKTILYILAGLLSLILAFGYGAKLLFIFIGCILPGYFSVQTMDSENREDATPWLRYWTVFALFASTESLTDFFGGGLIPFYWLFKSVFILWLMPPMDGASLIYDSLIRPRFLMYEATIDRFLKRGKEEVGEIIQPAGDQVPLLDDEEVFEVITEKNIVLNT